MSKTETAEAATNGAAAAKVADLGLLEEDDEFEEFPAEDEGTEEVEQARVWEDNWDDDTIEDDFSNQLRNMSSEETAPMSRSPPPLTPPPSKKRCVQTTPPPTKTPSKQDKTESRSSNGTATNGNSTENNHSAKNGSSTPTRGRRARGSSSSQRNGTSSPEPAAPSTPTRASTRLRAELESQNRMQH